MSELEPRDVALLRDAREALDSEAPGAEVRARVRARLAASLPIVPSRGPGGGGGAGSAAAASVVGKVAIAVTALLVGGAAGAGLYAELREAPPPQIVYVPQPIAIPVAPPSAPPPSTTPVEPLQGPSTPSAVHAAPSRTSQIAAERVLLDEARAALVQGDPNRALDRVDRHRRTFATPILGEERDAMEVEALVRAGRSAEARAKAEAFRRRTPGSLFLPAVESAIESIP